MCKVKSPLFRLWIKFFVVLVPLTIFLGFVSYWLTIILINHAQGLKFLGIFPLLIGVVLVFRVMFAPDLKLLAIRQMRKRARRRAGR